MQTTLSDSSQSSTPELTECNVTSIAELVLDASLFSVSADTVKEGESLTASVDGKMMEVNEAPVETIVVLR